MANQGEWRTGALVLLALPALVAAGCGGSGGDDQGSSLQATFVPGPAPPAAETVFLQLFKASGSLITLDVVGRDISAPLDGIDLVISFDPLVLEAFSVSETTFLGVCGLTRPDNTQLLCLNNIDDGGAAATGELWFSAYPTGTSPEPETIAGDRVLATVSFRAVRKGESPLFFFVASSPGGSGNYSRVTSASDPGGAAAVIFSPAAPDQAVVQVKEQ